MRIARLHNGDDLVELDWQACGAVGVAELMGLAVQLFRNRPALQRVQLRRDGELVVDVDRREAAAIAEWFDPWSPRIELRDAPPHPGSGEAAGQSPVAAAQRPSGVEGAPR